MRIMTTTSVGVRLSVMDVLALVVASGLNRLGAEDMVKLVAPWVLVNPLLDRGEHVAVDLTRLLAECWVMEGAEDVLHNFADWYTWVLPCEEHTSARY